MPCKLDTAARGRGVPASARGAERHGVVAVRYPRPSSAAALAQRDEERPAKRRRVAATNMAVRASTPASVEPRRQLRQSGYRPSTLVATSTPGSTATPPRELLYPNWKSSDFFHNADSEPPIPLSGPGTWLLPGIEAAASSIAGERLVCLQANATLYSAATNAQLGDHKDGSPFSVVVHVSASRPETAGLIFNEELVLYSEPGAAVLLRGDEYTHRSCAVDEGQDRLVLVFFLDFASATRAAHPRPPASAREVFPRRTQRAWPPLGRRTCARRRLPAPDLATRRVAAFCASVQSATSSLGEPVLSRPAPVVRLTMCVLTLLSPPPYSGALFTPSRPRYLVRGSELAATALRLRAHARLRPQIPSRRRACSKEDPTAGTGTKATRSCTRWSVDRRVGALARGTRRPP